jgi:hypothetical protein
MPPKKTFYEESYRHGKDFKVFEEDTDFIEREKWFCNMRVLAKHAELDCMNDDLLIKAHKGPNENGEFSSTESFDEELIDIHH